MNSYVEFCLKNFVANRTDLFDGTCSYSHFVPDNKSDSKAVGGGHHSSMHTGKIAYRRRDQEEQFLSSTSFALKLNPSYFRHYSVPVAFVNEIQFFAVALPVLRRRDAGVAALFATYYESAVRMASSSDYDAVIVLENLLESGYRDVAKVVSSIFLDYDHLSLMARKLAAFHAASYRLKRADELMLRSLGDLFSSIFYTLHDNIRTFLSLCADRGLRALRTDPKYGAGVARIESTLANCEESMRRWLSHEKHGRFATLCHGDYLAHNTMVKCDQTGKPIDLKIIDMASCTLASPLIDLSLLFYFHMDQRKRDQYWDALLDEYCENLRRFFMDGDGGGSGDSDAATILPSKDDLMDEFRTKSLYAYVVAAFYLPWRMAAEKQMPSPFELMPDQYRNCNLRDIPNDIRNEALQIVGGDEATEALVDILKDIIDRGFV